MMYGFGFPWMGGIAMMLLWVVVLGAIVWAVVAAARSGRQSNPGLPRSESPLDVLQRRYAAGEINREQLEEMKRNLA